jgi:hypothetical protein
VAGHRLEPEVFHDQRPRFLVGKDRHLDVADAEDVARRKARALGPLPVDGDAVGGAGVADDEAAGAGLDHRVTPGRFRIVQDEVAGRIAADDRDVPLDHDLVHGATGMADREPHAGRRWEGRKTARL